MAKQAIARERLIDRRSVLKAGAVLAAGGPALLFTNVVGHPGAVVLMNQFGSESRMKLALEVDSLDAIAERMRREIEDLYRVKQVV